MKNWKTMTNWYWPKPYYKIIYIVGLNKSLQELRKNKKNKNTWRLIVAIAYNYFFSLI